MKSPQIRFAASVFCFFLLFSPAYAITNWYVDVTNVTAPWDGSQADPFQTIQEGIDAAFGGDTVIVLPGTYVGLIDFGGKGIIVRSKEGPILTIMDGNQAGSVVTCDTGETASAVLTGFTITNGLGPVAGGGGLFCYGASPTIVNNFFFANSAGTGAPALGGAIYCDGNANPLIRGNVFEDNTALKGAGIYTAFSSPEIRDNLFYMNNAGDDGGGICCFYFSGSLIQNNRFYGNTAVSGGGITFNYFSAPSVYHNTFEDNQAYNGGAIHCNSDTSAEICNNLIVGNTAVDYGGGIWALEDVTPTFKNCTIYNNTAAHGGGVYCLSTAATFIDTIIYTNHAPDGPEILGVGDFTYCDVKGGWQGTGNINDDPLFAYGMGGIFYLSETSAGQGSDSPCINVGSALASAVTVGTDTMDEFSTRTDLVTDGSTVDMGFHYVPEYAARQGNVNLANADVTDVLFVNGSPGDEAGYYTMYQGTRIVVSMSAPPTGPNPADFTIYVHFAVPGPGDLAAQPHGIGIAGFAMPLSNGTALPPPVTLANTVGYFGALGFPLIPGLPGAPTTVYDAPTLAAGIYAIQGYIFDNGSGGFASLTNMIIVEVL